MMWICDARTHKHYYSCRGGSYSDADVVDDDDVLETDGPWGHDYYDHKFRTSDGSIEEGV